MFDPEIIRSHFPFFSHHPELVYFANAATTQKPASVIRGIAGFYEKENTNVHRGLYKLAANTSQKYEQVRQKVADYIGAEKKENIVFTSGTTAGINLVAQSFLAPRLQPGDEVVISIMEHHANFIPWQQLCKNKKANLRIVPINKKGELDISAFKKTISQKTKMVAAVHVSNSLGTINPIKEIIDISHKKNIPVLIDGAQSAAHFDIDVNKLDADFFVFSGHKMYGPTGIGILYGKEEFLINMQPAVFGGDAIKDVRIEETIFADPPKKFEPGTQNIAGVIGLGLAIGFLNKINKKEARIYLNKLTEYATDELKKINGLEIIGRAKNKSALVSFIFENIHPHDMATFLGAENIAVRAGNHCTQPLMDFLKIPGTVRASFSVYNTFAEVDRMVGAVRETEAFFR
ncbi:MAG TPA: cysteine desulfurase [Bacteroidetes bacterium]|nr:cysteine desulfurase [Bacteroidota bacterium]